MADAWMSCSAYSMMESVSVTYCLIKKVRRFVIQDELTEITLAHDAKAWSIPTNRTAYFEGIYTSDLLSQKDTVCTAANYRI